MVSYFLIDFENVHENGFTGMELLTENDTVILFYSMHANMISMDILSALRELNVNVKYIPVEGDRKNALDYVLSTHLGCLCASEDTERCVIISNDTGYDTVRQYWMRCKKKVYLACDVAKAFSCIHPEQTAGKSRNSSAAAKPQSQNAAVSPDKAAAEQFSRTLEGKGINNSDIAALWMILKQNQSIKDIAKRKQAVNSAIGKKFDGKKQKSFYAAVKPFIG